jgi:hypothetical protein
MYWPAGINAAGGVTLFTFEPNEDWAAFADMNLRAISNCYQLTVRTVEGHADAVLMGRSGPRLH